MEFNIENFHLQSSYLFDYLSSAESQLIKSRLSRKEYNKGESVFKEGSFSKGVYIIRKGKVKIFRTNLEGKQSIIYIYKKGDFFGYRPLLAEEPHPLSAIAIDPVVVSFLPKEAFLNLMAKSPSFSRKIAISLSKEFSVWVNKFTLMTQLGVKERVALSLLILGKIYRTHPSTKRFGTIALNRDDFAGFVGTAKETLVRALRIFKNEGFITSRGTKISIKSSKALALIVEGF